MIVFGSAVGTGNRRVLLPILGTLRSFQSGFTLCGTCGRTCFVGFVTCGRSSFSCLLRRSCLSCSFLPGVGEAAAL